MALLRQLPATRRAGGNNYDATPRAAPLHPLILSDRTPLAVRVGVILDAKPHPNSDKLYVETIDLGEPTPRQILSGLAHFMTLDQVWSGSVNL